MNARIVEAFTEKGADAWFADGAKERFLARPHLDADAEVGAGRDILDVWFDSGSTHAFTLETALPVDGFAQTRRRPDRVMYLEGSDQHRGWFQSSLLEILRHARPRALRRVLTHGFVLDEKGRKMSKSLGNIVAPQDVIKKSGADILRLWVAASDYADDLRIGKEILKTFVETYRKLRNTLRWMLGALAHLKAGRRSPSRTCRSSSG